MSLNTINLSTPFLIGVPNSKVSPEWIRLFAAIIGSVSGGGVSDDTQAYVFTSRKAPDQRQSIDELRSAMLLSSLRSAVSMLTQRVADLEVQLQKKPALPVLLSPDAVDNIQVSYAGRTASASNAASVRDDNASNVTVYPVWSNSNNGVVPLKASSTQWTFNPSTGKMAITGPLAAFSATAIPAGGTAGSGYLLSSTANFGVFFGSGAPTLSAAKGSLYLRSDGTTTNNRAYINSDGATAWTALTTAA